MSNKFWDQHSIKGKTDAAHDHVYGASKGAATTRDTDDPPTAGIPASTGKQSTLPTKSVGPASMSYGGGHNDDSSHPGFAAVESKVEKEGYSKEQAGAIVASTARHASAAAKKANPNLKKVKG